MELTAWIIASFAIQVIIWLLAVLIDRWWRRRRLRRIEPFIEDMRRNSDQWKAAVEAAWRAGINGEDCRPHMQRLEVFKARSTELFELAGVKPPK